MLVLTVLVLGIGVAVAVEDYRAMVRGVKISQDLL